MLDTDALYELRCLRGLYAKELNGSRKFELMDGSGMVRNEDFLLQPGRIPFPARIFADWELHDGRRETVEWPNLPSFLKWGKVALKKSDRRLAESYDDCMVVYLQGEGQVHDDMHVFYDRMLHIWKPVYEGVLEPGMKVRAAWLNDDTYDTEFIDWPELPAWRK